MSDLAFLSSDEEDNNVVVDEVPEEDSDDDEFGNDFEFGGLLVSMFCLFYANFCLNHSISHLVFDRVKMVGKQN